MEHVQIIRPQEGPSLEIAASIFDLMMLVWPPKNPEKAPTLAEEIADWKERSATQCIILDESVSEPRVLAHALLFRREVFTSRGALSLGALASVCVHPDSRGRGWGADVTRAAFAVMPKLGVEVSLFQTLVPEFYDKLGAHRVYNRFSNGLNPDDPSNPFWDFAQMIYPSSFEWPEGEIDINGEAW